MSEPGGSRVSSPDNELVTKSEILTNSNRDRLRFSAANGSRCRKDARSRWFLVLFSVQVFRTSAGKKYEEEEEQEPQLHWRMTGRLTELLFFLYLISRVVMKPGYPDTLGK